MEQLLGCDHLRINPSYSSIRRVWYNSSRKKKQININSLKNLKDNDSRGIISKKASSKIVTRLNWLHTLAKNKRAFNTKYKTSYWWKLNLVTLTLPEAQREPDTSIKKRMLNTFLLQAKRKWKLKLYIWKAEKMLNGRLHFHIATDVFIPHQELRNEWNSVCNYYGLNTTTKNGGQANSTDVHSMRKIKNVLAYMVKYFAKNEDGKEKVTGRLWGCCQALSVLNAVDIPIDYELNNKLLDESEGKRLFMKPFKWCTVIYNSMVEMSNLFSEVEMEIKRYILRQWDLLKYKKQKLINQNKIICNTLSQSFNTSSIIHSSSQLELLF